MSSPRRSQRRPFAQIPGGCQHGPAAAPTSPSTARVQTAFFFTFEIEFFFTFEIETLKFFVRRLSLPLLQPRLIYHTDMDDHGGACWSATRTASPLLASLWASDGGESSESYEKVWLRGEVARLRAEKEVLQCRLRSVQEANEVQVETLVSALKSQESKCLVSWPTTVELQELTEERDAAKRALRRAQGALERSSGVLRAQVRAVAQELEDQALRDRHEANVIARTLERLGTWSSSPLDEDVNDRPRRDAATNTADPKRVSFDDASLPTVDLDVDDLRRRIEKADDARRASEVALEAERRASQRIIADLQDELYRAKAPEPDAIRSNLLGYLLLFLRDEIQQKNGIATVRDALAEADTLTPETKLPPWFASVLSRPFDNDNSKDDDLPDDEGDPATPLSHLIEVLTDDTTSDDLSVASTYGSK